MSELRNPFNLLTAEHITPDTFLELFGPGILDIYSDYNIWDRVNTIQSVPGAGKTTLLRLLTPTSLIRLFENQSLERYRELYSRLYSLGFFSEEGPSVIGVLLSCNKTYHSLEDLGINNVRKERMLLSLLNSRIIIAFLRSLLKIYSLDFPRDLKRVTIRQSSEFSIPSNLRLPCNGYELFTWASNLEKSVMNSIDSFSPLQAPYLTAHDDLFSVYLINPVNFYIDDEKIQKKVILMLDDLRKLHSRQIKYINSLIVDARAPISIWISKRLETLPEREVFNQFSDFVDTDRQLIIEETIVSKGILPLRDHNPPITLETYWRSKSKIRQFEKLLSEIADRRVQLARDVRQTRTNFSSFEICLKSSLDGLDWIKECRRINEIISNRIINTSSNIQKYAKWIEAIDNKEIPLWEKNRELRALEIKISRTPNQRTLINLSRSNESDSIDNDRDLDSSIKNAADLFISKEFGVPYYFGFDQLVKLSSINIEQFLYFSAGLFEESISNIWIGKSFVLDPKDQERILRSRAKELWYNLKFSIPDVDIITSFIDYFGEKCKNETYKDNAPYAPGVTGFGLRKSTYNMLMKNTRNVSYNQFIKILSICLSLNIIEMRPNVKQGNKEWMVFYLNRYLCILFDLPLYYGGWRSVNSGDIMRIIKTVDKKN